MMADDGTEGAWARRTLRLPPDLDRAVAVAAAGAGVAEAELIRQLVRRGLAQRAGASASPEIAAEVDTLLERRLAPLQRLLWVTAWQAASVHARVREAHIDAMLERLGGDGRDERFLTKRAAADRRAARSAAAWVRVAATAAAWDRRGGTPPQPTPGGADLEEALGVGTLPPPTAASEGED